MKPQLRLFNDPNETRVFVCQLANAQEFGWESITLEKITNELCPDGVFALTIINNGGHYVSAFRDKNQAIETIEKTAPGKYIWSKEPLKCRHCKHRRRYQAGGRIIQYCNARKSNRTQIGLLKIKAKNPACLLFENSGPNIKKLCFHSCSPSDYYKGGKCDKMGCL